METFKLYGAAEGQPDNGGENVVLPEHLREAPVESLRRLARALGVRRAGTATAAQLARMVMAAIERERRKDARERG
jgi:hypothetical protein